MRFGLDMSCLREWPASRADHPQHEHSNYRVVGGTHSSLLKWGNSQSFEPRQIWVGILSLPSPERLWEGCLSFVSQLSQLEHAG